MLLIKNVKPQRYSFRKHKMTFDPDWKDRPEEPTRVVNLRNDFYDVYIGRPGRGEDGYFGNRHSVGFCSPCGKIHTREQCIAEFKKEFLVRIESDAIFRAKVGSLKGKRLGCFCSPLACHGNVYAEWLDNHPNL